MPVTPWAVNGRARIKTLKATRRRLAISARYALQEAEGSRFNAEDEPALAEERRLLEGAAQLLMEPGIQLKERRSKWQQEVDMAARRPLGDVLGLAK